MLTHRAKVIMIMCLTLCLGVIVCTLGMPRLASFFEMLEVGSSGQAPIRSFRLTIDKNQREELFDQLRKFADKHGFEFHISDYGTGGEAYLIEISRNDIIIDASIIRPDPNVVSIGFFAKYPGYSVDEEVIDELVIDLKSFIHEIPNVTITEEK